MRSAAHPALRTQLVDDADERTLTADALRRVFVKPGKPKCLWCTTPLKATSPISAAKANRPLYGMLASTAKYTAGSHPQIAVSTRTPPKIFAPSLP